MEKRKYCDLCQKNISIRWFLKHRGVCKKVVNVSCEYCGATHDGTYGAGIFCSSKCARGFSSYEKREEINLKVSSALSGKRGKHYDERVCKFCGETFIVNSYRKRNKLYCSKECANQCPEVRAKQSKAASKRVIKNKRHPFGYSSVFDNGEFTVKCDSVLERCCINYLLDGYDVQDISRCDFSIPYLVDGFVKRYVPDFQVLTKTGEKIIVECKCDRTTSNKDTLIWKRYYSTAMDKKRVLEEYCDENGYLSCWFTQRVNTGFYREFLKGIGR